MKRRRLFPRCLPEGCALPEVLTGLEKDTDAQVLLVQGPPDLAKSLAAKFPGFDIVVATSDLDPDADPEPLNGGKTILVKVAPREVDVGVVGLYNDPKQVSLSTRSVGPTLQRRYRSDRADRGRFHRGRCSSKRVLWRTSRDAFVGEALGDDLRRS